MTTIDSYQNQDLDNTNPLQTREDAAKLSQATNPIGAKIPKDPKMRLLLVLLIIVVLLLIASIFTSASKKTVRPPTRVSPTPTSNVTPLPTEKSDVTKLPTDIKEKLDIIDGKINTNINFNPPQIDTEIGL